MERQPHKNPLFRLVAETEVRNGKLCHTFYPISVPIKQPITKRSWENALLEVGRREREFEGREGCVIPSCGI